VGVAVSQCLPRIGTTRTFSAASTITCRPYSETRTIHATDDRGNHDTYVLAVLVPGPGRPARTLRALCILQLPVGMAGVVWDEVLPIQLARAASFTAAYVLLAIVIARLGPSAREVGSGVLASFPNTTRGGAG